MKIMDKKVIYLLQYDCSPSAEGLVSLDTYETKADAQDGIKRWLAATTYTFDDPNCFYIEETVLWKKRG